MNEIESNWLNHAWNVLHCPRRHMERCLAAGTSTPGVGRRDGNELRWPGYLGETFKGILCVSHVHTERDLSFERERPDIAAADRAVVDALRSWKTSSRSQHGDDRFLRHYRHAYRQSLSKWDVWTRHYKPLVEQLAGLNLSDIAFTNLVKCRVPFEPASGRGYALIDLCQREFPIYELIEALQARVVLLSVLPAAPGGRYEVNLSGRGLRPHVIAWQGRTGHDRHNTDPGRRPFREWAPQAAALIKREADLYRFS